MENKEFEKEIIETFGDFIPELDHDDIWENIEPHLKKKKRRRFLLLWFLIGGLGLTYLWSPAREITVESVRAGEETTIVIDKESVTNAREAELSTVSKIKHSTTSIPTFQSKLLPPDLSTDKTLQTQLVSSRVKSAILVAKSAPEILFSNEIRTKEDEQLITEKRIEKAIKIKEEILEIKEEDLVKEKNIAEEMEEKEEKKKIIKPKPRHQWHSYLQASVAPILPFKHLGQGTSRDLNTHRAQRRNTETQLEAFGINLNLQVHHNKGLVFVTGLEYQQFNERFDLERSSVETEVKTGVISEVENNSGDIIQTNLGLKSITTTRVETRRAYNNYQFINVPLGIGKKWTQNKLRYQIVAGVQYNWYYRFKGTLLNEKRVPTELNKKVVTGLYNSIYRNKAGFGLWFSTELRFAQSPRLDWVIAPKLQFPLRSLTQDDYSLSQRYFPLSLNFGFNYQLLFKR